MAKSKLSERQQKMLEFIGQFSHAHGYPPTIRQIGEAVSISSTSVVNYNLKKLAKDGYVARDLKVSRGVRLMENVAPKVIKNNGNIRVPLVGFIFASNPTLVGDTAQTAADEAIELTRDLLPDANDLFALRVKGDSMIDAMVNDGDIVVMKKVTDPRNGDMVAVWLKDRNETTLKHFYRESNGQIRLQPANPTMQPIFTKNASMEVQGKVMLVLRQMQ